MNTRITRWFHVLFPRTFVALLALLSGCTSTPELPPNYNVTCRKSASFELGKAPNYDPKLRGYWLVGNGATINISPVGNHSAPGGDLVLSLRTTPEGVRKNDLSLLRIVTPQYHITTRLAEENVLRIETPENASHAHVGLLRDMKYVRIYRDENRIKVVLSGDFLYRYAPNGAALTWFDTTPGALIIR